MAWVTDTLGPLQPEVDSSGKAVDRYSFYKHLCGEYVTGFPAAWEAAYQL